MELEALFTKMQQPRAEGRKIGFTCSCFDLLHAGHYLMLKADREQCDFLVVGLQTDPNIDKPYRIETNISLFTAHTE